jgi:hypothetical protein
MRAYGYVFKVLARKLQKKKKMGIEADDGASEPEF